MGQRTEKIYCETWRAAPNGPPVRSCRRFRGIFRRGGALLVATALALGMTVAAVAEEIRPIQVTSLDQFPNVTVETNLVANEASGEPDLVTEVDGKQYGFVEVALRVGPGGADPVQMGQIFAALAYDNSVLTPVTWNARNEESGKVDQYKPVELTDPAPGGTYFPAKKADVMDAASARILGEDETGYTAFTLFAASDLTTTVNNGPDGTPATLHGDSRLAVVRFRYDAAVYKLSYQEGRILNNGQPLDRDLIVWANDANAAASDGGVSAVYVGATPAERMYYVHNDPNPLKPWTAQDKDGLLMPDTAGKALVKAVKEGEPTNLSYVTNFFPVDPDYIQGINGGQSVFGAVDTPLTGPKIKFTQVSTPTADQGSGGISLDDIVTVVFFDWDNTFLGATAVARGVDSRETVNEFVQENFVHPDIVAENYTEDQLKSSEREYTYRGKYEHIAPGRGTTFSDGGNYLLTNHLDYVFYKTFDDEFYYDDGWAEVMPLTMPDTWTTLGSGSLEGKSEYATFDFQKDCQSLDASIDTIYVKAVYAEGKLLDTNTNTYTAGSNYNVSSYGNATDTIGNYLFEYQYERVNSDGYGVKRRGKPVVQVEVVANVDGAAPYYMEVVPDNKDVLDINVIIAKGMKSVDYILKEAYGGNVISGAEASINSSYGTLYSYQDEVGYPGYVRDATQKYILEQIKKEITGDPTSRFSELSYAEFNDSGLLSDMSYSYFEDWEVEAILYGQLQEVVASGYTEPTFFQIQYTICNWYCADEQEAERWYWEEFWPQTIYYNVNEPFERVTYP